MVSTAPAPEAASDQADAPPQPIPVDPIILRLPESWPISEAAMLELWEQNPEWDIEVIEEGALSLMPGTGFSNSEVAIEIATDVNLWRRGGGGGHTGGADGAVNLGGRPMRIPDVSWISDERYAAVADDAALLSVCPDFVVEVRSRSDQLEDQQTKMERWLGYGARLGWLIDTYESRIWVYREGESEPELLERPETLSGEGVMPGLSVDLSRIWDSA